MSKIFINYRRRDDAYAAAYLDDALSRRFGRNEVFRAGRSIPPGENYEEWIHKAVAKCLAMLVIIGPDWTNSISDETRDSDWVHREITTALHGDARVVPILLSGTPRIEARDLPADLSRLSILQYLRFDYRNTEQDLAYITSSLLESIPGLCEHSRDAAEPQLADPD